MCVKVESLVLAKLYSVNVRMLLVRLLAIAFALSIF